MTTCWDCSAATKLRAGRARRLWRSWLPDGVTTNHDLPEVETGGAAPAAVWDMANDRVLVVAATEDVVWEVSFDGSITEHPWDGEGAAVTRQAALSPDGTRLYIASAATKEEDGVTKSTAQDLIVLDPVNWASGQIIDRRC